MEYGDDFSRLSLHNEGGSDASTVRAAKVFGPYPFTFRPVDAGAVDQPIGPFDTAPGVSSTAARRFSNASTSNDWDAFDGRPRATNMPARRQPPQSPSRLRHCSISRIAPPVVTSWEPTMSATPPPCRFSSSSFSSSTLLPTGTNSSEKSGMRSKYVAFLCVLGPFH